MILTTSGTERFHYFLEYDYYIGYAGFGHSIMFSPLLFISSTSLEHGQEDILEKQITIANCLFLESIGIWKISLEPTALLIRDFQNYVTALHPDAAHRLLALMFYMPQDDSTLYLGTSIYRPMMILKISMVCIIILVRLSRRLKEWIICLIHSMFFLERMIPSTE